MSRLHENKMVISMAEKAAQRKFNLPNVKISPHFDYTPIGPFYMFSTNRHHFKHDITLEEAFELVVRYSFPAEPGESFAIADNDGVIVLGYNNDRWWGLEAGFDLYRDHPLTHPLEYELAVTEAKENR